VTHTTARRRSFGAVAAVALLFLGACSGTGEGNGVASAGGDSNRTEEDTEREALDEEAQALAFAECMREEGIDMPDPAPGQGSLREALRGAEANYDRATYEQALTACEDLLPQREHEGGGHDQERDEDMLALAECLRERGLDVPDNLFEGGALHDIDDDELRVAYEECRDEVVGGGHQ
jgi:hypothetical protein